MAIVGPAEVLIISQTAGFEEALRGEPILFELYPAGLLGEQTNFATEPFTVSIDTTLPAGDLCD